MCARGAAGSCAGRPPMSDTDGETDYSGFSNDEFLDVLRTHLADRSWTLDQWLELERRGYDIAASDPKLMEAIGQETQNLRDALEPLQRKIFKDLEPLQQQLKDIMTSIVPQADLKGILLRPDPDGRSLTDPAYIQLDYDLLQPTGLRQSRRVDGSKRAGEAIESFALQQEERMTQEAEVRKAHLETAISAAAQLKVMERLENVVTETSKRGWYEWCLLILAAVAAIASVIAIFIN